MNSFTAGPCEYGAMSWQSATPVQSPNQTDRKVSPTNTRKR